MQIDALVPPIFSSGCPDFSSKRASPTSQLWPIPGVAVVHPGMPRCCRRKWWQLKRWRCNIPDRRATFQGALRVGLHHKKSINIRINMHMIRWREAPAKPIFCIVQTSDSVSCELTVASNWIVWLLYMCQFSLFCGYCIYNDLQGFANHISYIPLRVLNICEGDQGAEMKRFLVTKDWVILQDSTI